MIKAHHAEDIRKGIALGRLGGQPARLAMHEALSANGLIYKAYSHTRLRCLKDEVEQLLEQLRESLEEFDTESSFTCPKCGWKSYNPHDVADTYCGHCHEWTGVAK